MAPIKTWPAEHVVTRDPVTGAEVIRLTTYKGNHNHLYFTSPGWYDSGWKLAIDGDRDNRHNLFSVDLETFEISQLTDLPDYGLPFENNFLVTAVDGARDVAYVYSGKDLLAVDLHSCETRKLWTIP